MFFKPNVLRLSVQIKNVTCVAGQGVREEGHRQGARQVEPDRRGLLRVRP